MRTDPIETYRGVLIYKDTPKDRSSGKVAVFRCVVNGVRLDAPTLETIKQRVDQKLGPAR